MRLKLMIMLVFVTSAAGAADALQSCMDKAMTQPAMNSCAQRELDRTDAELNRLYRELQSRYKDDLAFTKRLQIAQSAWIKFRDAQLEMMFPPHPNEPYYYGSVYPMCSMQYAQQLTSDREVTLKQWLTGSEEGDVCTGSVKPSSELRRNKNLLPHNGSSGRQVPGQRP